MLPSVLCPLGACFLVTLLAATAAAGDTTRDWYPHSPKRGATGADLLSLASWLDAPAGRHGRVRAESDRLLAGDQPIKLWGLNVCYDDCAPTKALADRRAEFYARHGINAVRLHKFADGTGWAGIQSANSFVVLDPAELDRMDYFVAALKKRGIYVKLSPTFGVKVGPADAASVPYLAELGDAGDGKNNRVQTKHGAIYLSRELQDLQIAQMTRLLAHKNPYTGLTYADEPAIAFIELFNEDSALFFGTFTYLKKSPTLRARAARAFTDWLARLYGSEEKLLAAWGPRALNAFASEGFTDESFAAGNIAPVGNPWFFDPDQLEGSQAHAKQRLLDTMAFLAHLQDQFYARYAAALRAAGYPGEFIASNWHSGRAFSHYHNLASDARIGTVDRHNYFNGPSRAMVSTPGSGSLSSGLTQVAGRPFMLSEWIHVWPHDLGVEGPALISAYGFGLQGWDASFMFQNRDDGRLLDVLGNERWQVTSPQILGLFPAVSRLVHRGDVAESTVTAVRRVNTVALRRGELDFTDLATQKGDIKTYDSDKVPAATLAVARTLVEFTSADPATTATFDLAPHRDAEGTLTSTTGQLRWHAGRTPLDVWFTIDTPGTQAVVGFAAGRTLALGDVTLAPARDGFAALYVTALERDATLATGRTLLVTALARARNTGFRFGEGGKLSAKGTAPVLLEPVRATLTFKRAPVSVELLDHTGHATGRTLPLANGAVELDTARDRTPYYLIRY